MQDCKTRTPPPPYISLWASGWFHFEEDRQPLTSKTKIRFKICKGSVPNDLRTFYQVMGGGGLDFGLQQLSPIWVVGGD